MIYRDLLKISVYFIAIKLLIDFSSKLPERIYNTFCLNIGNVITNILLYALINIFVIALLIVKGGFIVEFFFKKNESFLKEINKSNVLFRVALIVCSYYVIISNMFSFVTTLPAFTFGLDTIEIFVSIAISLLLVLFSGKITNSLTFNEKENG
ncbi:hypothetical protein [Amniculibacterium sp. G2-70]|uniref:hypothetical protein n=1 Tax=Amniculibacterium sp. G2-70 TaxID=2767188 RepID=UPI00165460F5|nr:hypothetical protein [Amniculibacterium sp. G2-70]